MIVIRSPLRITLGGGGTDLPSYYRRFGGRVLSAAIDKYVYIAITRAFRPGIYLKYSELEIVNNPCDIKHSIFRTVLMQYKMSHVEITALADIPAGTGLGSSSSFTVALLSAVHAYNNHSVSKEELAREACEIELELLKNPIGKQDQYVSAYGGLLEMQFNQDDSVHVSQLNLSPDVVWNLENNLLLFFTGFTRSAATLLADQDARTCASDKEMLESLHATMNFGAVSKQKLDNGDLIGFGEVMHEHWMNKRERSPGMTSATLDCLYNIGKCNGAIGGKVVGAGGGGFLMFFASDKNRLRTVMSEMGLEEVRFKFDMEGTKQVMS